jgi:Arc/MetJ-type ribon-helix-helix transcriptional regulator
MMGVARSIHVRLDQRSEDALGLLRNEGLSDSQAVRTALREAGARRRIRSSLLAEVDRLAADESDRAEITAVRAELDELAPAEID